VDAAKGSESANSGPAAPAASSKATDAAKQVLTEMEKTGGAAGGSIQTHHGDE
jgi:hypothetical protein